MVVLDFSIGAPPNHLDLDSPRLMNLLLHPGSVLFWVKLRTPGSMHLQALAGTCRLRLPAEAISMVSIAVFVICVNLPRPSVILVAQLLLVFNLDPVWARAVL